jgi:hypothetical protein
MPQETLIRSSMITKLKVGFLPGIERFELSVAGILGWGISPSQDLYLHNICALWRIRNRDSSVRSARYRLATGVGKSRVSVYYVTCLLALRSRWVARYLICLPQ